MSIAKKALLGLSGLGLMFSFGIPSANAMPNPASENCVKQGGKLELVNEQGGQAGYCTLPNGVRCDEWALFRKECPTHAKPAITGGYTSVSVKDAGVQAAARFAAGKLGNKKAKLTAVHNAESQVVAGKNYRIKLSLSNRKQYEVVVFQDLNNRYQLTSAKPIKNRVH